MRRGCFSFKTTRVASLLSAKESWEHATPTAPFKSPPSHFPHTLWPKHSIGSFPLPSPLLEGRGRVGGSSSSRSCLFPWGAKDNLRPHPARTLSSGTVYQNATPSPKLEHHSCSPHPQVDYQSQSVCCDNDSVEISGYQVGTHQICPLQVLLERCCTSHHQ